MQCVYYALLNEVGVTFPDQNQLVILRGPTTFSTYFTLKQKTEMEGGNTLLMKLVFQLGGEKVTFYGNWRSVVYNFSLNIIMYPLHFG
jgi:hypothetical protein